MNILIFGTGATCKVVEDSLKEDIIILAYVDNDMTKQNSMRNGIKIIPVTNIKKYDYDCIIIASQFNNEIFNQLIELGADKNKIVQFFKIFDIQENQIEQKVNVTLKDNYKDIISIATGISYTATGLSESLLKYKTYNLAHGGQDLYYDYNIAKYIISNLKNNCRIKYCIIGMSYYTFQYDLSLSSMNYKVLLYYDLLKDGHNKKNIEQEWEGYRANNILGKKLFNLKKDKLIFSWKDDPLIGKIEKSCIGQKQAKLDCNKNYPETVKENKQIFGEYLELLKDNNIKPIVVVFPASKYYTKYFSKRIADEFHSIINEIRQEYKFQYIDYFRSNLFYDNDFQDVSHLNPVGAEKFTKILNDIIEW